MKNTLIFDFITGEIHEVNTDKGVTAIISKLRDDYVEEPIVIGRDNFEGHNVWFIKHIANEVVTRLYLERQVYTYLHR